MPNKSIPTRIADDNVPTTTDAENFKQRHHVNDEHRHHVVLAPPASAAVLALGAGPSVGGVHVFPAAARNSRKTLSRRRPPSPLPLLLRLLACACACRLTTQPQTKGLLGAIDFLPRDRCSAAVSVNCRVLACAHRDGVPAGGERQRWLTERPWHATARH